MSNTVVISGAGLWKPDHVITNDELVAKQAIESMWRSCGGADGSVISE